MPNDDVQTLAEAFPWARSKALLIAIWTAACAAAAGHIVAAAIRPKWDQSSDLHVYYGSIKALLQSGSLYDFRAPNGDPFTYPPFAGIFLSPLIIFPEDISRWIWLVLNLCLVFCAAWVISKIVAPTITLFATASFALLFLVSAPLASNLRLGQVSWILAVFVAGDALRILPPRYQGIATGIAAAVKLTPLIFIPYYWFTGARRQAITASTTFVVCSAAAALVVPNDSRRFWLTTMWDTDRIGNLAAQGNQSLNAVLLRVGIPQDARTVALGLLTLVIVTLGLWRATRAARNGHLLVGVAIAGTTGVVISPVSWTHHQVWIMLAAAASLPGRRLTAIWRIGLLAAMVVSLGQLLTAVIPHGAIVGDNLRGILAIAIAAILPFEQLHSRTLGSDQAGSVQILQPRRPAPMPRRVWQRIAGMAGASATIVVLLGCQAANSGPDVSRPLGQVLRATISSGDVEGSPWRIELVEMDGRLCLQSVVNRSAMGHACDLAIVSDPVNFVVEGNDKVMFVYGVANVEVAQLKSVTKTNADGSVLALYESPNNGPLFFGYAVAPSDAVDLIAYTSSGNVIYHGGKKIVSTRDDTADVVPSAAASQL